MKNPTLLNVPLAVSAQTVIYNLPDVSGHVRLDGTVLAVVTAFAFYRAQRWLARRTNRVLSPGLVLASLR